ncbi:DUF5789 family protein (plasmid) [Haloarcula salina]|uniref:DUF5789 family protein n=1 Tax=Haloarcula salina TaxID=1429914 RepID=UPI003C6F21F8
MGTENSADASGDTGDSREHGVELGSLADELAGHDYPTTTDELLDEYGAAEIELTGDTRTFREVLGEMGNERQEYESAQDVRQMIYNMVGEDAVGRKGYSDRGGIAGENTDETV